MVRAMQMGGAARARNASVEMTRRALNDAAIYATVVGGVSFVLIFLTRLPFVGVAFVLLRFLLGFVCYPVVGFLVTAHLHRFYHGPTRTLLACHFGLGVAITLTAGIALASLLGGLLLIAGDGSDATRGFITIVAADGRLIAHTVGNFVPQLITGTLLAVLGSFVAFDRDRIEDDFASLLPKA